MANKFEIEGLEELTSMIKELGSLPQKCVTGSAKDGAKIALAAAKVLAMPADEGNLVRGIILKGEKKPPRLAKKVYDVMMDPKMRDVFARTTSTGKRRTVSDKGKVAYKKGDYYYPASIEFGFLTKDGRKVPGRHFLRDSLVNNKGQIESKMLEKLSQLIDKELSKKKG